MRNVVGMLNVNEILMQYIFLIIIIEILDQCSEE